MSSREEKILEILKNKEGFVTGKELGAILNVSDRSIRNDIGNLNSKFPGIVEASVRYGYRVNEEILNNTDISINHIPQTPYERRNHILKQLLSQKNKTNLLDLEEELYISCSTLKKELKHIDEIIFEYNLSLVKRGNAISINGTEENKRSLYKKMLSEETNGNFININNIAKLFSNFDLIKVKDDLEKTFEKYDYSIREENFPLLIIHIGIAISRMISFNHINGFNSLSEVQETLEYKIIDDFFDRITKYITLSINEYEKAFFTTLLIVGKKNNILCSLDNSRELTEKIINEINSEYGIDFSGDLTFKDGIIIHIQNLLERMSRGVLLSNVSINEIKRQYPLVFDIAVFVAHEIEKTVNKSLSEDEIGFLAIHVGTAYDRMSRKEYYHAILIQPNSNMMSNICVDKIYHHFGDRLVVDRVINYYEEKIVEQYDPDIILTTIPLKLDSTRKVINISLFLSEEDEHNIFKTLSTLEKIKLKKSFDLMLEKLIVEECFFYDLDVKSSDDAIDYMCDCLEKEKKVKRDFKEAVKKREEMAFTSFASGYAIPHALGFYSLKSTIAIAKLKREIKWGDYNTRLVFLLAIKEDDKDLLRVFFDWFSGICEEEKLMRKLLDAKTCEEFKGMIVNYGE